MKLDHRGEADQLRRDLEQRPRPMTLLECAGLAALGLFVSAFVECARHWW